MNPAADRHFDADDAADSDPTDSCATDSPAETLEEAPHATEVSGATAPALGKALPRARSVSTADRPAVGAGPTHTLTAPGTAGGGGGAPGHAHRAGASSLTTYSAARRGSNPLTGGGAGAAGKRIEERCPNTDEDLSVEASRRFAEMVDSVGVKRFAEEMGLSTRQVNRMLSGAQPNPVERMTKCLLACEPEVGDRALDFICDEMGGFFVREEAVETASRQAVKECAEAIVAISDGEISRLDEREIREAVEALIGLARAVRRIRRETQNLDGPVYAI